MDKVTSFLKEFRQTQYYLDMLAVVEASPWHREANVAVHTEMVIEAFNKQTAKLELSENHRLVATIALAFHDVGKPKCEEQKWSAERGNYRAYHGHEQVSARHAEAWLIENFRYKELGLTEFDVFVVGFLIQEHLPFDLKDKAKLKNLRSTVDWIQDTYPDIFQQVIMGDQLGRISDDEQAKLARVAEWFDMFNEVESCPYPYINPTRQAVLLIGVSGAGKSTLVKEYEAKGYTRFSWDVERLRFTQAKYAYMLKTCKNELERYEVAFHVCSNLMKDEFRRWWKAELKKLMGIGTKLVIDNTNISKRSRNDMLGELRQYKYSVEGIVVTTTFANLLKRAKTRDDHLVPENVITNMWQNLQYPTLGEVDSIALVVN